MPRTENTTLDYLLLMLIIMGALIPILWIKVYSEGLRFSLRTVFVFLTLICLLAGYARWLSDSYNWQLDAINAVLVNHPEVTIVEMLSNKRKGYLEVERVVCRIGSAGKEAVSISIPPGAVDSEIREVLERAIREEQ